jgi:hypothetical protein
LAVRKASRKAGRQERGHIGRRAGRKGGGQECSQTDRKTDVYIYIQYTHKIRSKF